MIIMEVAKSSMSTNLLKTDVIIYHIPFQLLSQVIYLLTTLKFPTQLNVGIPIQ
jgi:hypothetical protein